MSLKEDSYHFRLTDVVEKKEDRQLTFQYYGQFLADSKRENGKFPQSK